MIIFKVDALAGAGKTYSAIEHAAQKAITSSKTLIIQPTKLLIEESLASLRLRFPDVRARAIHGGSSQEPISDIMKHLAAPDSGGEVLFITQAAFFTLPHFNQRKAWNLIVDEIPQVVRSFEFLVPQTHRVITDHFAVHPHCLEYGYAEPTNIRELRKIATNKGGDEVWAVYRDLAAALISDHWNVFVSERHHAQLIAGNGSGRVQAFAVMSPSIFEGFQTTIIMGASFDESFLAKMWKGAVNFRDHRPIKNRLRYSTHQNSERLAILYACEEDWSKNLRDRSIFKGVVGPRFLTMWSAR